MERGLAIWWIKRDIRVSDNVALCAALAEGTEVLAIWCLEPSLQDAEDSSDMHLHAQITALTDLRKLLRALGGDIFFSAREVLESLEYIHHIRPIGAVHTHEEIGNALTYARDRAVARWCREGGIGYREHPQSSVKRGGVNRDKMQTLWRDRIEHAEKLTPPRFVNLSESLRKAAASTSPPLVRGSPLWQAVSEHDAERTLNSFLESRSKYYRGSISAPLKAMQYGSRLSVHLAWGTISLREVYQRVRERLQVLEAESHPETARWRMSLGAFLSRLHWRDHFIQRLESEPELEFRAIHPAYRDLVWENSPELQNAWVDGRTGFPLVDAVMRCLAATGFINFRMRALVVSFACHALHLDWRLIHPHLARVFRDYEPGIHLSQLQMQAGVVGLNTIRIYNPQKQLLEQDSECRFVKRWLPELRDLSKEKIQMLGVLPAAADYPRPIIDWAERSRAMREVLYALRKSPEAAAATKEVFQRHGSRLRRSRRSAARARQERKQLTLFRDSL